MESNIGKGSEDLESGLMFKGCIFESEINNFFIKDPKIMIKLLTQFQMIILGRVFCTSKASYYLKDTLSKLLKNLSNDKDFNYELSSNAISLSGGT